MSEWIITTAITLGIGVITYFLKRTMSQVDKHGEEIRRISSRFGKTIHPRTCMKKILTNAGLISNRSKQSI